MVKTAPPPGFSPATIFAALGDNEAADDRKAESQSTSARGVAALEFFEEAVAHRGRQAGTAIGDGEEDARAGQIHAGGEKDRRVGGR